MIKPSLLIIMYIFFYLVYMINIQKMINMLYKSRDKLLKNKAGMSIIIYFTLLFTIDYLGIMDLYGQNILRRCINMRRRIDPYSSLTSDNPCSIARRIALSRNASSCLFHAAPARRTTRFASARASATRAAPRRTAIL